MLRAENAEVLIHPSDRKYGALLIGGQGTGQDHRAARLLPQRHRGSRRGADRDRPQVRALAHLPAHDPARLRQAGLVPRPRPPGVRDEPAAADRRPAAGDRGRADRRERRRRAAGHQREPDLPVLAPLPLPRRHRRDRDRQQARNAAPRLEDVYTLLRPAKDEFRSRGRRGVRRPARPRPDRRVLPLELPDDLRMATSRVAERLDAPRNKISGLTGVPPLRRFFNHPTDIPLREIIEARDILIVDANMGAIGDREQQGRACCSSCACCTPSCSARSTSPRPSARGCRCSSTRPTTSPAARTSSTRSPPTAPPASNPRSACSTSRSSAPRSEHQQKILKGVLNLLQSRFLFRMGDAQDAEQATRIAMAVYATMIRDDPDSRARLRVTPEQAAQLPQLLLPRLLDRQRHPRPQLHRPDLPAPRRRRRVGRAPPRRDRPSASAPTPSSSSPRSAHPRHVSVGRRSRRSRRANGERAAALDALGPRAALVHPAGRPTVDRWRTQPTAAQTPSQRTRARTPRRRARTRRRDDRPARKRRGAGRLRAPAASHRTSPTAPSAGSSDAGYPAPPPRRARRAGARQPARARVPRPHQRDRRRPTSSTAPPSSRASTTRTTRSSRCSTAPASRRAR